MSHRNSTSSHADYGVEISRDVRRRVTAFPRTARGLAVAGVVAVVVVACIVLMFVPMASVPDTHRSTYAWAATDGLLVWGVALMSSGTLRQRLLSPLGFQALGYSVFFCLPAVYTVLKPEWDVSGLSAEFPRVLQALAMGFLCEAAGYYCGFGGPLANLARRHIRLPKWDPCASRVAPGIWLVYAVAWSARVTLFLNDSYFWAAPSEFSHSSMYQLVGQVDSLGRLVLVILSVDLAYQSARARSYKSVVFVFLMELLWYLPAGKRQPLAELGLSIVLAWLLTGHRVRWVVLVPAATITGALFCAVSWYRAPLIAAFSQGVKLDATMVSLAVSGGVSTIRDQTFGGLLNQAIGETVYRISDITSAAAPFRYTPSVLPFQYGRTYLGALFFPVPRIIWPGKPSLVVGAMTTPHYFPWMAGVATRPITLLGECYLNFGYLGIPAVMFLWGLFLRTLYEYCRIHNYRDKAGLAFYVFIASYFIWTSPPFADVFELATRVWLFVTLAVLCIKIGGANKLRRAASK